MPDNSSKKTQATVNERLKILIESLNMSARAFSALIGVPDSNTRNYLSKGTKLNSDYLESIASHFSHVNLGWLITGAGEPFLTLSTENTLPSPNAKIFLNSPVVGKNRGTANQQQYSNSPNSDAEKLQTQLALAQQEIESLRTQLEMKDTVIAAKDQTIDALKTAFSRP